MHISTRGRYGLRALVELAEHRQEPRLLKEIAASQDISMKYLGHIISNLKKAGIISRTSRGYLLAEDPAEINCWEVITALEGSLAPVECVDNPALCDRHDHCRTSTVFVRMKQALEKELQQITLEDLAAVED